jgi:hypothetical protein
VRSRGDERLLAVLSREADMNVSSLPRAAYLLASVRTVADELERVLVDADPALGRALREQLAEQLDALSRLLREEDGPR